MKDGPMIASVAALVGDPARANMLTALMDGRALTVSELADAGGITLQTASGHLAKLKSAHLLTAEKQGRHRYFRLSGADVADALEALMNVAERTGSKRIRTGPRDTALREARVCYDHLAGERGVMLLDGLLAKGWLSGANDPHLTKLGQAKLTHLGLDIGALSAGRRPLCRRCLDWSERRIHLGGTLGAALLDLILERRWARHAGGRVVAFTPPGVRAFTMTFGAP